MGGNQVGGYRGEWKQREAEVEIRGGAEVGTSQKEVGES